MQCLSLKTPEAHRHISSHEENPTGMLKAPEVGWLTELGMFSYLKFVFDLAGVGLRVQPADTVVERAELAHGDGGVATETRFQDGVMHEHVLLLQRQGDRE